MMSSIRARLLLWMAGGMGVLLILLTTVVYGVLNRSLQDGFDEVLLASARTIGGSVEQDGVTIKFEMNERDAPEFYRSSRPDYFQLWLENGASLARSPSLKTGDLTPFAGSPDTPLFRSVHLPDGRDGRAVCLLFTPRTDEESRDVRAAQKVTLVAVRETDSLDSTIRYIRWLLGAATGGALVLTVFVAAIVVRRGLRPLDVLAARIAAVRQDDLSAQLPIERMPAEMVPVVRRLNDLLLRLGEAFRRERSFTADAAHELRTPLTGIRCTLEVALSQPRTSGDYRDAIRECLETVRHMQGVIESLLALARLESGQATLRSEPLNVRDLVETEWETLSIQTTARGITFDARLPADLLCSADRDIARMIIAALLSNAVEYTDERGRIEVVGVNAGGSVELTMANSGCALSEEDARHVFDRFWRGDPAHTGTGLHSGLGLALVQRAATALGGSVSARAAEGRFTIRLILPACRSLTP